MRRHAVLLICFIALSGDETPCSTSAQMWILNVHGAPVTITSKGERAYSVDNVGAKAVISYQVGCIRRIRDSIQVIRVIGTRSVDWRPGQGELVMSTGQLEPRGACARLKAFTSITHVEFADGTKWDIPSRIP